MALRHLLLWLMLLALPSLADAQTFPALSGRVVDAANLLDPAPEAALNGKLAALEQQTGRQLVVVTIPDLEGRDIADYGYRLGRAWGIGEKGRNTGALLIVAPSERRVRIEVGYGLEGVLTDAMSSLIINNVIVPRFKQGDFTGGIDASVDEIIALLKLPPEEARKRAEELAARQAADAQARDIGQAAIVIIFILIFVVVLPMLSRRGGRRYGSGLPVILWGPSVGDGWGSSRNDSHWGGGGGGFSGGGGSFGGGGASGSW